MERTTKHLLFKSNDKGEVEVYNKKDTSTVLGWIYYYKSWKKHVFEPSDAIFDCSCLNNIEEVLKELDEEKKNDK